MSDNKKDMKENSSKAAKNGKKEGFFAKVGKFFREYRSELKKISWPTFAEVVKNTLITLMVVLLVGIVVWAVDWGVGTLRDVLISKAHKVEMSDVLYGPSATDALEEAVSDADGAIELTQEQLQDLLNSVSGADAE